MLPPRLTLGLLSSARYPLVPTNGLLRQIDIHLFDVQILLDAPFSELAAEAALLVAAPRRLDVRRLHVIDPDDARTERLDGAHRAEDVARPHRGGEPVVRVVRDPDRVGLGVERNDAGDRTENLLARDARRVVDVVEDGRLDEVAALVAFDVRDAAAGGDLRFALADLL